MGSESYHEPLDLISEPTKNLHRAIVSLIEELEAIDWYGQRAEACSDAELRAVLLHHRDEEIEHAMMNLEWLRRSSPDFDEKIRTYIGTSGPITAIEAAAEHGAPGEAADRVVTGGEAGTMAVANAGGSLGIGSLKGA
jgi:ferritin-like protein